MLEPVLPYAMPAWSWSPLRDNDRDGLFQTTDTTSSPERTSSGPGEALIHLSLDCEGNVSLLQKVSPQPQASFVVVQAIHSSHRRPA